MGDCSSRKSEEIHKFDPSSVNQNCFSKVLEDFPTPGVEASKIFQHFLSIYKVLEYSGSFKNILKLSRSGCLQNVAKSNSS